MTSISVIIPVLNDAPALERCLERLAEDPGWLECLVVDGGSADDPAPSCRRDRVRLVSSPRGRAIQMNTGARESRGEVLWFLHADCEPRRGSVAAIMAAIEGGADWGAFRFALGGRGAVRRAAFYVIEHAVLLRTTIFKRPYGDQGLFVTRRLFEELGG